jgi:hypothetical protein
LPDGQIAFHGRIDEQIKIRGYRIDPIEVVSVLNQHPSVAASAVGSRQDNGSEKRLVGYVVAAQDAVLEDSELREFLRQYLPEYMLPSLFVRLDSLPIGHNGKLDRAALPVPADDNIIRHTACVSPRGQTEQRLAVLLESLLRVGKIGVNDNFFRLGGNSLLGAQVINRVSEEFGVELTLLGLFDHPTVAGMAGEIEKLLSDSPSKFVA